MSGMSLGSKDGFTVGPLWRNGPTPGSLYHFPATDPGNLGFVELSKSPATTGASIVAFKYDNGSEKGVILASDMLGSYGSLARFRDCRRLVRVNKNIIIGAGGDYADFQYLQSVIEQKNIDDECLDDGFRMKPKSLYTWLTNVMYNRRSKLDPFWNNLVVAGMQDGEPYLGTVDKLGAAYEDDMIATGMGSQMAIPLIRDTLEKKPLMSKKEAQSLMVKCMEVLFYRDARSFPKYQIGFVNEDGAVISDPLFLETNWDFGVSTK